MRLSRARGRRRSGEGGARRRPSASAPCLARPALRRGSARACRGRASTRSAWATPSSIVSAAATTPSGRVARPSCISPARRSACSGVMLASKIAATTAASSLLGAAPQSERALAPKNTCGDGDPSRNPRRPGSPSRLPGSAQPQVVRPAAFQALFAAAFRPASFGWAAR